MQFFELHFNPAQKEDSTLESFAYEPESASEKKLGSLFMVGELSNVLPSNSRFLDKIASAIKESYYQPSAKSAEKAIAESLKNANELLSQEVKKDNVSWLGNLNFVVVGLKDLELNFTKIGNIKIFLLKSGEITDIGERLEFSDFEPYPLKIFSNVVSGKLAEDDVILILTKKTHDFFKSRGLLAKIAKLDNIDKKNLREILRPDGQELSKISGICFLIVLRQGILPKESLTFREEKKGFSFSGLLSVALNFFKKIELKSLKKILPLKFGPQKKEKILSRITLPKISKAKIGKPKHISFYVLGKPKHISFYVLGKLKILNFKIPSFPLLKSLVLKRNVISFFVLIFLLFLGFLIFKKAPDINPISPPSLNGIQEKVDRAESFLIIKDEKQANILLKEAWNDILTNNTERALQLKKSIEEKLFSLNKLTRVDNPELVFEFSQGTFAPRKILIDKSRNLFFFNPILRIIYKLEISTKNLTSLNADSNPELGAISENGILFFSKPSILMSLNNGEWTNLNLKLLSQNFDFDSFASYGSNIYFLDSEKGEIVKYPSSKKGLGEPSLWFSSQTQKPANAESITVDNSIWFLSKDNSIAKYYKGQFQEEINLNIFPFPKDFSKILTKAGIPYLYILEPVQNRIIITEKNGNIVKQFQSEKFDQLLDFAVSEDGKTIYLLNGLKIYEIEF